MALENTISSNLWSRKTKTKSSDSICTTEENSHDCGLFAIANMLEFVTDRYSGLREDKLHFKFIQSEMREHPIKCLSQKFMEPFPKIKLSTVREVIILSVDIDFLCCCSVPDLKGLGSWIVCDICDQSYLQHCEGIDGDKIPKMQWYTCKKCQV